MSITFANKITIARILAVPFFIATVLYYAPERDYLRHLALGIFLFAVISDVIDGYVARTRNQMTEAGAMLDPLADKILLISAFICLYKIGVFFETIQLPIWLVVVVISRDVILFLGTAVIYLVRADANLKIEPSWVGKGSTFFQVLCILGILLQLKESFIFWYLAVLFGVVSGVDYVRIGINVINQQNGSK